MTLLLGGALAACGGADGSQAAANGAAPAPVLQEGNGQFVNATVRVYKAPD
jgi:hypothetical protein